MDYPRIYGEFIADRLTKQPCKPTYFEKHHIVPRSLGGGDDAANLIRLTPEDHYFAHLLLAQIHGGWAWTTVKAMCHGFSKAKSEWRRNRPLYGIARRKWAEFARSDMKRRFKAGELVLRSGAENNKFNPEEFSWVNLDTHERRVATMHAMHLEFGGARPSWTSLANGSRQILFGWKLAETVVSLRSSKGKVFNFVHRDGRAFEGTQQAFCEFIGTNPATATRVCKNESVTRCGWRLTSTIDRSHHAQKSDGAAARRDSGVTYEFEKDGVLRLGKIAYLAEIFGSSKQQLHAGISQIKHSKMTTYKGWRLVHGEKQTG